MDTTWRGSSGWISKALSLKTISALGLLPLYHQMQARAGRLRSFHPSSRIEYAAKLYQDVGSIERFNIVEIGTGWVPVVPVGLYLLGAQKVISFDLSRHLQRNLTIEALPKFRDC